MIVTTIMAGTGVRGMRQRYSGGMNLDWWDRRADVAAKCAGRPSMQEADMLPYRFMCRGEAMLLCALVHVWRLRFGLALRPIP